MSWRAAALTGGFQRVFSARVQLVFRRISDAIFACLLADAREPDSGQREGPGRATGERL
jgi:hypothetical protein